MKTRPHRSRPTNPAELSRNSPRTAAPARARRWRLWLAAAAVIALGGTSLVVWAQNRSPREIRFEVVKAFPHDRQAYCQGLVFDDGVLYEGTGQYGGSSLRRVDLETGRTELQVELNRRYFGEGIMAWRDRIVQLTWKQQTAFIYDKNTFQELDRFGYRGEGWGLTHDGQHWILSNGSATLQFLDPETKQVVRQLTVRNEGRRVHYLNELEYIEGQIYANVWRKDYIVSISPSTGEVTGWLDLRGLFPHNRRSNVDQVLNGIAYDAPNKRLFVTGKNWPQLFELRLLE